MPGLVRITTVPVSMQVLLKGQMKFMQQHGFTVTMVSSDGPEVKALEEQEQCRHLHVPFTRTISPVKDLVSLFKLVRILRQIKPQIVHTHTPKAGLIGMWAALLAGVPVRLHTIAGLPWMETTGMMRSLLKLMEKLTAMPACQVYPNSIRLHEFLKQQGIAANKMKVLGKGSSNGIDARHFSKTPALANEGMELRRQQQVSSECWIWIFVGRIVKDKGMNELLDAFLELYQQFPQDKLWLVGTEEPELDPLDEAHRNILHSHPGIHCWGFQKDIRPYLAAAQVLAFPSYREGFPNVPMQAGAMECMLLLSDINGCNEIVENNENGMLVPVKNTAALCHAMLEVRQDPSRRERFAKAIRTKIESSYDQQYVWNLILQEYQYWMKKKGIIN